MTGRSSLNLLLALALCATACSRCSGDDARPVAASYGDAVITEADLQREVQRLPAGLREQFESEYGRREFIRSMVDKRLLALEARRRGIAERPEIQRQVQELEERITIQALLADEERAAGNPGEAAARTYYEAHKADFSEPERVRVARVFVAAAPGAPAAERTRAQQKAEALARRLKRGEKLEVVVAQGEGPERARGGELGLFGRGEFPSAALEKAGLALSKPGAVSPVVAEPDGYSVLVLMERRTARIPAFEEVRRAVENRLLPSHKRKVFDALLEKLRAEQKIEIHAGAQR